MDLPGRHGNSQQHQISRELADHNEAQGALLGWPTALWRATDTGQRGREQSFCLNGAPSVSLGFGPCLERRAVAGGGGVQASIGEVLRACWGPSQACAVGCWGFGRWSSCVMSM